MKFRIPKPGNGGESLWGENDDDAEGSLREENPEITFAELEQALGYSFQDYTWLIRAFTHRSVQRSESHYERLEFLGDAVLDLAIADLLLAEYPQASEGELSKMRAALVNTEALAAVAKRLHFGPHIRLSRGEMANNGQERSSILADVFEAVIGGIYRDSGYAAAFAVIEKHFASEVASVDPRDPKTELQEALHVFGSEPPEYQLECVEGPEHSPTFVSVVSVDGQIVGRGKGRTKKASQQAAAAEALERIGERDEVDKRYCDEPLPEEGQGEKGDDEKA